MDLYVQRHGLAGDPDSDEYPNDDDRPLTAKGIRRIGRQVRGLNSLGLSLDAIITSPWYERSRPRISSIGDLSRRVDYRLQRFWRPRLTLRDSWTSS